MADYAQALQALMKQRQASQVTPEELEAADEQARLGNFLNQINRSQAMVGNVGGKVLDTGGVDFAVAPKLQQEALTRKADLSAKAFSQGLSEQDASMDIERFKNQQLAAEQQRAAADQQMRMGDLNYQAKQFDIQNQPAQFDLEQQMKKAQIDSLRQKAKEAQGVDSALGKEFQEAMKMEKLKAALPNIKDPATRRAAEITLAGYEEKQKKVENENFKKNLTPGELVADREYAKKFVDYESRDRGAGVESLNRLNKVLATLTSGDTKISGAIIGRLPEGIAPDKAILTRDMAQQTAIEGLRAALGAQFTEKDREVLTGLAYNPKLGEEANAEKIKAQIEYTKKRLAEEEERAAYFREKGTLKGFKSKSNASMDSNANAPVDSNSKIINGVEYIKVPGGWKKK